MISGFYSSGSRPLPMSHLVIIGLLAGILIAFSGTGLIYPHSTQEFGFCLPSPNLWPIPEFTGWIINTGLLLGCAVAWIFLNKEFTLVKGIDQLTIVAFLMFVGSNPVCTDSLTTGSILLSVTVLCLSILFGSANRRNSTHQIFVIYTFLSIGSMFQYAFVPMMLVFLAGGIIMKTMRTKEVLAMILGIIAPYWIALGLGLVPLNAFRLPTFTYLFTDFTPSVRTITLLSDIALSGLLAILLCLSNTMVIFAGNKQTRARNNVVTLIIFSTLAFVVFDFGNMNAYLPTFYFALAVQVGNLFAYHNLPWRRTILWSFTGLYAAGFFLMWFSD